MSDSGHVIGEDNPYHDNFSGSFKAELAKRDAENATLREWLVQAEQEINRLESLREMEAMALVNGAAMVERAEKRAEAAEATLRTCCENEEAARTIAAMLIGGSQTEGDNYCVPSIADLMVMVVGRAEAAEVKVAELEAKLKSTEGCLTSYKLLCDVAINAVDRVFQVDSTKPPPLLPDFLKLGDCKFEGVMKLAEAYKELQAKLAAVRSSLRWAIEQNNGYISPSSLLATIDANIVREGECQHPSEALGGEFGL